MKTKRGPQNIIVPCNLLSAYEDQKQHINKKSKLLSDKVERSISVEENDSDSEIVIVYPKVVYPKEVQHGEKSKFHHFNKEGGGRRVIVVTIFQNVQEKMAKHNLKMIPFMKLSHVDPPELWQNKKYSHMTSHERILHQSNH